MDYVILFTRGIDCSVNIWKDDFFEEKNIENDCINCDAGIRERCNRLLHYSEFVIAVTAAPHRIDTILNVAAIVAQWSSLDSAISGIEQLNDSLDTIGNSKDDLNKYTAQPLMDYQHCGQLKDLTYVLNCSKTLFDLPIPFLLLLMQPAVFLHRKENWSRHWGQRPKHQRPKTSNLRWFKSFISEN
mgnify:CR=1 FL=1